MSNNIHTLGQNNDDEIPPPFNPWTNGRRMIRNPARVPLAAQQVGNQWGGGAGQAVNNDQNQGGGGGRNMGMRLLGFGGGGGVVRDGVDASNEPELMRYYNKHMYDPFWTDSFPPDVPPSYPQMMVANCGCGCCLGPCCGEIRQSDWKRLFLTFTLWTAILEFLMLIIEVAIGGLTWPSLGPDGGTLSDLGSKELDLIYCKYQVFRYITPVILHAGVFHYLFNMFFAYRIMLPREVYWGMPRMIAMYVVSGVGGTVMSLALYPATGSVGASGALCGIFGGYVVDVGRMWKKMSNSMRYQHGMNIVMYLIIMVMIGFFMENIDNGAHLGGFLTGIFFGLIILQKNLIARVIGGCLFAILWAVPTVVVYAVVVKSLLPGGCRGGIGMVAGN